MDREAAGGSRPGGAMRYSVPTVVVMCAILSGQATLAGTWRVPDDHQTIAAAAVAAAPGDSILVACGTYFEHGISLPSGVTVQGAGDAACVVIDARERGRLFSGTGITLKGLTLKGGLPQGPGGAVMGSGEIESCRFEQNATNSNQNTFDGGAVAGQFTIRSSAFLNNTASGYGGAISGSTAIDCLFVGNSSSKEWGGAANGPGPYVGCRFEGNYAYSGGHAIYFYLTGGRVERCEFTQNRANGGVVRSFGGSPTVVFSTFWNNILDGHGGDASLDFVAVIGGDPSSPRVENCTIYGEGVAIRANGNSAGSLSVTVSRTILALNSVALFPVSGGTILTDCCDLWQNGGKSGQGYSKRANLEADPMFCDPAQGLFALDSESPCLPDHSGGCGLIGAHESDCGAVPTQKETLGGLRNLYR